MKKTLWLGIFFSLLFASHSFAATPILSIPTPTSNVINATLTGGSNLDIYQLIVQTTAFSNAPAPAKTPSFVTTDPSIQAPDYTGLVTWSLSEKANTTYYVRVMQISTVGDAPSYIGSPQTVQTSSPSLIYYPLTTTLQSNGSVKVLAQLSTTQPNYTDYTATLSYSTHPDMSSPSDGGPGIKDNTSSGVFYWLIPTQTNTPYYAQETYRGDGLILTDPHIISFDGGTGASIAGTASNGVFTPTIGTPNSNQNPNYYTLLSGFPGLTVLPDPTLCATERAQNKAPQFCDLNDVLNYFMKLLIGLCGVMLVFRLMYEGFVIMTSDLPFKVASSKGAFMTALSGLLLALCSYLLLNTINPKLVNESVGLTQLSIGVAGDDGLGVPGTSSGSGTNRSGRSCKPNLSRRWYNINYSL